MLRDIYKTLEVEFLGSNLPLLPPSFHQGQESSRKTSACLADFMSVGDASPFSENRVIGSLTYLKIFSHDLFPESQARGANMFRTWDVKQEVIGDGLAISTSVLKGRLAHNMRTQTRHVPRCFPNRLPDYSAGGGPELDRKVLVKQLRLTLEYVLSRTSSSPYVYTGSISRYNSQPRRVYGHRHAMDPIRCILNVCILSTCRLHWSGLHALPCWQTAS